MTERQTTLLDYFRSGKSVCPFARSFVPHFATLSNAPRFDRAALVKLARGFVPTIKETPYHAMVLVRDSDEDLRDTRHWAIEGYLALNMACALVSEAGTARELERHIYEITKRQLLDTSETSLRPHMLLNDEMLITTCMAPCYPPTHPRWAPHTMLLAVWTINVAIHQAINPELLERIRDEAHTKHGAKYDADELVLTPLKVRP